MLLTLLCWFAIIFFFAATARKAMEYAKKPMHGRQDLYPIPLEDSERAKYGGSYYEDQKWFEKPRKKNELGMVIDMLGEMLFIKKLFKKQQKFWWISYSLHLGIYLFIGTLLLAGASVILPLGGILAALLGLAVNVCGLASGILVCVGTAGLLVKRIVDREFRSYTTPQEYFNLAALFAGGASGLIAFAANKFSYKHYKKVIYSMLHFKSLKSLNKPTVVHLLIICGLLVYIPLCKMSHYVGKYFTFHNVIWDNDPNLPGSKVEKKVIDEAGIKPAPEMQWAAPHYQPKKED
jgi:nitrate reductase gamma subunit